MGKTDTTEQEFSNLDEIVDHIVKNLDEKGKEFLNDCSKAKGYNMFKGKFEFPEVERIDHKRGEHIFSGNAHHGYGTGIRNNLHLWWTEKLAAQYKEWPQERPKLIAWFDGVGLDGSWGVVGDDRSGLLVRSVYRKFHNLDLDVEGYVSYLKKFYGDRKR